jgi:hypothetical protein
MTTPTDRVKTIINKYEDMEESIYELPSAGPSNPEEIALRSCAQDGRTRKLEDHITV